MKTLLALIFLICAPQVHAENWNLRTSPLGLVGGEANLRLDYRIADHWMAGPEASYINRSINGIQVRAQALGFGASYYFYPVFAEDGPYVNLSATVARERAQKSSGQSAEYDNNSVRLLGGYHWFWSSFNMNVGAGLASNSAGRIRIRDSAGNEVDHVDIKPIRLALDFSLGLSF